MISHYQFLTVKDTQGLWHRVRDAFSRVKSGFQSETHCGLAVLSWMATAYDVNVAPTCMLCIVNNLPHAP